MGFNVPGRSE